MPRLEFDKVGERFYEAGVDHGVLFVMKSDGTYDTGVAWNGLTSVTESREGGEQNDQYADNIKYISITTAEQFKGTIEAFTYPDEFMACDGEVELIDGMVVGQQTRKGFGFVYRTKIGNDTEDLEHGYKLHFVYNAKCTPTEKAYETINDSPEAMTFSWEFSTTPVEVGTINGIELKPTAHFEIDSRDLTDAQWTAVENLIYGTDGTGGATGTDPTLPSVADVYAAIVAAA